MSTAPDPGIDVLLDVYMSGTCVGLAFFVMTRIADWYVQYRTTGDFTILWRTFGSKASARLNGGSAVFTWRTDLAYFFIGVAPITLFCLFKSMEVAPDLTTTLNELRGVVITATMSVLSVILMCADVLRLVFPHRRKRYTIIEGFTMVVTLVFQIVNTVLVYFDSAAGVFRFDQTFFPIHCGELFSTLLLTEGFLLYGIYSNVLNSRNAKKLHMRNIYITLSIALLTHFCHISLIVFNHREGITLDTAVPRIVMLFTSFNLFVVLLHSMMRLVNRINDTVASRRGTAVEMDSKSNKSKGTFVPTGAASAPSTGRPSTKPPVSPRSQPQHQPTTPRASAQRVTVSIPPADLASNTELHHSEESAAPMEGPMAMGIQRSSTTTSTASKFGGPSRPSMMIRIE